MINKKIAMLVFLAVFSVLASVFAIASASVTSSDVSIDKFTINNLSIAENKLNLVPASNSVATTVEITSFKEFANNLRVQVIVTDVVTGFTVSKTSDTFSSVINQKTFVPLNFTLGAIPINSNYNVQVNVLYPNSILKQKLYSLTFGTVLQKTLANIKTPFDVSIDRVAANGDVLAQSRTTLVNDANNFIISIDFTAVDTLENAIVEANLRSRRTGNTVSNAVSNLDLAKNQSMNVALFLNLVDGMRRDDDYDVTIKVSDARGRSEQESYGLRTRQRSGISSLDASIDRVRVNSKIVASSSTNFIDEDDDFNAVIDFTALGDLDDARIEAVLRDVATGVVVADSTSNFDLNAVASSSRTLNLQLIDSLKNSNLLELVVRIADTEGGLVEKSYGLVMESGNTLNGGLDTDFDSVEVESIIVVEDESNFITLAVNDEELDVKVKFTALEDMNDAVVEGTLVFENGDVVSDASSKFDLLKDRDTSKKLNFPLIWKIENGNLRLKIKIRDEDGNFAEKEYLLRISRTNFPFVITKILLDPEDNVGAGKNLVVDVGFRNIGVSPSEILKMKVSIPELEVTSTKQISNIKSFSEAMEEAVLKIPENTPSGAYTVRAEIFSQFGTDSESKEVPVNIVEVQLSIAPKDRLVIKVPVTSQSVNVGKEASYPITFENQGTEANTYTLLLDTDADARLSNSNVFVLKSGESKTITLYASSENPGKQSMLATVKTSDKELGKVALDLNVKGSSSVFPFPFKDTLKTILIVLVVILGAAGLVFGVRNASGSENSFSNEIPDEELGESYY